MSKSRHSDLGSSRSEMSKRARGGLPELRKPQAEARCFSSAVLVPVIACTVDVVILILQKRKQAQKVVGCIRAAYSEKTGSETWWVQVKFLRTPDAPPFIPPESCNHFSCSWKAKDLSLGRNRDIFGENTGSRQPGSHRSPGSCLSAGRSLPTQPGVEGLSRIVIDNCIGPFISRNPISNSPPTLMARKAWTKHSLMNSDLRGRGCLIRDNCAHTRGRKNQGCIPMMPALLQDGSLFFPFFFFLANSSEMSVSSVTHPSLSGEVLAFYLESCKTLWSHSGQKEMSHFTFCQTTVSQTLVGFYAKSYTS